jgi:hypothetical protein
MLVLARPSEITTRRSQDRPLDTWEDGFRQLAEFCGFGYQPVAETFAG